MQITIYENGVWAGRGYYEHGRIEDCPAVLGDGKDTKGDVYEAIEQAIEDGRESISGGDYTWTWELSE